MSAEETNFADQPVFDPAAIDRLKEWGGSPLARKMIEIFLGSTGERMDQMREGLSSNVPETSERGAHSLKSSAGNVGAVRLQRLAEKAEALAADEKMDELADLLPTIETAFSEACDALRNLLEGMEE